jgi:hypothetical protein
VPEEFEAKHTPYVNLALAELSVLREEIKSRSGYQHAFINLAITALGVLAGIAVSQKDARVLLLIPLLSAPLGLLWIDHHTVIQTIGETIVSVKRTLAERIAMPQLLDPSGAAIADTILERENSMPRGGSRWGPMLRFAIHPCIIFGTIPSLILLYAVAELVSSDTGRDQCIQLALVALADLGLLVLFFYYWVESCVRPRTWVKVGN